MELADSVVIIHKGHVEQAGTPDAVYEKPATPFVASFIGSSNVLSGTVASGQAALGSIRVTTSEAEGRDVKAFIRHHQVEIVGVLDADAPISSKGQPQGDVVRITRLGWLARVELALADGQNLVAELPKDSLDSMGVVEGARVQLKLRDATVFVEDYVI